jgi:putative drug exporter of the RND superfamily
MSRFLARLGDVAYRRRGTVVLAWIAAMIVIIGVGSSLAGEYEADYDTPNSDSEAASDLTQEALWRLLRPRGLCGLEGPRRR